jgi:CRP-like cAMP-binding protein
MPHPFENSRGEIPAALLGLRPIHLLAGLPDAVLADIAQVAQFRRYRRGQTIVTREDRERDLCLISAGLVRVIVLAPNGREVRFRDIPAGEVFGELAALDGHPRCATVLALEDTLLVCIAPDALRSLLQHHWPVCERLLHGLAAALRDLTERVYALSALSVQQRLIAELLRLAQVAQTTDRDAQGADLRLALAPTPRHAALAARLGTSREQVTRELAALARDGLVQRDGERLWLCGLAGLQERLMDTN